MGSNDTSLLKTTEQRASVVDSASLPKPFLSNYLDKLMQDVKPDLKVIPTIETA